MNKSLLKAADSIRTACDNNMRGAQLACLVLGRLELSDKVEYNLWGGSVWITTSDRSDVEKVLSIAPKGKFWRKVPGEDALTYTIIIEDTVFSLHARDGALPPTCRLEEREEILPAQPEKTIKVRVLRCDNPAPESAVPEVAAEAEPAAQPEPNHP